MHKVFLLGGGRDGEPNVATREICLGSILLAKICYQTFFAIVAKEIMKKNYVRKSRTNVAKTARITNVTRFKT